MIGENCRAPPLRSSGWLFSSSETTLQFSCSFEEERIGRRKFGATRISRSWGGARVAICGARWVEIGKRFSMDRRHMARGTRLISRKKYASKARPKMLRRWRGTRRLNPCPTDGWIRPSFFQTRVKLGDTWARFGYHLSRNCNGWFHWFTAFIVIRLIKFKFELVLDRSSCNCVSTTTKEYICLFGRVR